LKIGLKKRGVVTGEIAIQSEAELPEPLMDDFGHCFLANSKKRNFAGNISTLQEVQLQSV